MACGDSDGPAVVETPGCADSAESELEFSENRRDPVAHHAAPAKAVSKSTAAAVHAMNRFLGNFAFVAYGPVTG